LIVPKKDLVEEIGEVLKEGEVLPETIIETIEEIVGEVLKEREALREEGALIRIKEIDLIPLK